MERAWVLAEAAGASGASPRTCRVVEQTVAFPVLPVKEEIVEVAGQLVDFRSHGADGGCPCASTEA